MRRIGLVLKRGEERAITLGKEIKDFVQDSGREVLLEPVMHELAKKWKAKTTEHLTDEVDLLVVLGGDGTLLRAASLLNDKSMPVLGINLGRVGFIAEISPREAVHALASVIEGAAKFVRRMLLQITLPTGRVVRVLNDAVIHWGGIARLIDLGIKMGASSEIELRADGLIVSTPTGSSAYSYAAHGPLIHPDIQGILLTPICPYIGLRRPLLIPANVETEIILKKGADLTLTLDGHTSIPLAEGQSIRVVKDSIEFIMVKSEARDYFDVLKEKKLGLVQER